MKKVLWLVSWYPNRLDNFDGDFIQRHARAVALHCKIHVIYVKKDDKLAAGENTTERKASGNLTEQIIYYNSKKTGIGLLDKMISHRHYKKHFQNAITSYIGSSGKPELVHVHVAMKAGVAALWIKKNRGIPYIVSEHWTAYLANADQRSEQFSLPFRNILGRVIKESSALTVVSDLLGKSIQRHFPSVQYHVIPNVVDTDIFYAVDKNETQATRFIHISNMNYQKNTEAILEALFLLKKKHPAEIYLYGPVNSSLQAFIEKHGLESCVYTMGEVPQAEIARAIQQSDALLLYSRFETFGCVLIEANACGIPVIVSELEVFHEIIEEGVNGIFVEGENAGALAEKLEQFIMQKYTFDKTAIASTAAQKYNFNKVGQQFLDIYTTIKK